MTCQHVHLDGSCLTICRPDLTARRRILHCPTCDRRRRMVMLTDANPYYAPTLTCCGCGDSWGEEGRFERPFARAWRTRATARARALWASA